MPGVIHTPYRWYPVPVTQSMHLSLYAFGYGSVHWAALLVCSQNRVLGERYRAHILQPIKGAILRKQRVHLYRMHCVSNRVFFSRKVCKSTSNVFSACHDSSPCLAVWWFAPIGRATSARHVSTPPPPSCLAYFVCDTYFLMIGRLNPKLVRVLFSCVANWFRGGR